MLTIGTNATGDPEDPGEEEQLHLTIAPEKEVRPA
jgi:hypothetical protein